MNISCSNVALESCEQVDDNSAHKQLLTKKQIL